MHGRRLLIAVPNVSDGRPSLLPDIAGPLALDVSTDPDHNRSVVTYGTTPSELVELCVGLVERAVRALDIRTHRGVHPRFGVVDVLPIVAGPDAESVATALAPRIEALGLPVYLYGDASPDNRSLPELRRWLRTNEHPVHPTAGVVCLGIRGPLVAFNVNFRGPIGSARQVARLARRPGIRALGFDLPSRGLVQVSMNLVEPDRLGPKVAFDTVLEIARTTDLELVDCEIVGLVPHPILDELGSLPLRTPVRSVEQALAAKGITS